MVDATAMTEDCEEKVDALLFTGPGEQGDGLADGFVDLITEDPGCRRIPAGDDSSEGHAEDGVVGGLDDRGKPPLNIYGILAVRGAARDIVWIGDATAHSIFTASSVTAHFSLRGERLLSNGSRRRVQAGSLSTI